MRLNFSKIVRYIPTLAPLPEGYAVYRSMEIMGWNEVFRVIAALIVAGTGFWGVQVMNAMAEYNATLRKKPAMKGERSEVEEFGKLPTWKAMIVLGVWFVGVTALTVFLDVSPKLQTWTPIGLVVVGFSAAYLFSLSNLHETRMQEREAYRQKVETKKEAEAAETKANRKEKQRLEQELKIKRQESAIKLNEIEARVQARAGKKQVKKGSKLSDAMLLLEWAGKPTLTCEEMAKKLMDDGTVASITRQAIDGRLKSMIKRGIVFKTEAGEVREVIFETASQPGAES